MHNAYTYPVTVTLYDLDAHDQVPCATLLRYFEETAMRGSSHFGFTLEWYRARRQFWVIRVLQMERVGAARYLDELDIRTWVSALARVRSDRNYEIRRARDGQIIARGIANWVYVDATTMTPTRVHPDIAALFQEHDPPILPPLAKVRLKGEMLALYEHTSTRRAQFYESDSARHTNNAVYVDWIEEAVRDALRAMGYALTFDVAAPFPWFYRHNLEYARAALPRDEIEIRVRLMRCGIVRGEWHVEILNAATREQILRAQTTMLWRDGANRVVRWDKIPRA